MNRPSRPGGAVPWGLVGMLAMVAALFWLASTRRLSRAALLVALTGLLVVDLFWLSGQFNQSYERSRVYPPTEITTTLQHLPPGRVLVVPADLESNRRASSSEDKIIAPPNTLLPYQIPTVAGKNQQFFYKDENLGEGKLKKRRPKAIVNMSNRTILTDVIVVGATHRTGAGGGGCVKTKTARPLGMVVGF